MSRLTLLAIFAAFVLNAITCHATCSSDQVSTLNATLDITSTPSGYVVGSLAWTTAGTKVGSAVSPAGSSGMYSGLNVNVGGSPVSADVTISFSYSLSGTGCQYSSPPYYAAAVVWLTRNGSRSWSTLAPLELYQSTSASVFSGHWTDINLAANTDDKYGIQIVVAAAINNGDCNLEVYDIDASAFRIASPTGC